MLGNRKLVVSDRLLGQPIGPIYLTLENGTDDLSPNVCGYTVYQRMLRNIREERRSNLSFGASLNSPISFVQNVLQVADPFPCYVEM